MKVTVWGQLANGARGRLWTKIQTDDAKTALDRARQVLDLFERVEELHVEEVPELFR
jgi:hypothetical protein